MFLSAPIFLFLSSPIFLKFKSAPTIEADASKTDLHHFLLPFLPTPPLRPGEVPYHRSLLPFASIFLSYKSKKQNKHRTVYMGCVCRITDLCSRLHQSSSRTLGKFLHFTKFLVISGCKEFSPTNNTHCNRRLYIASCLRLSVPVPSCRTQISLSISI
ncbi:hypothetical protein L2E82_19386 [Cichorium intybus]|uniref:Uncharacterized protein n=1 Tax=Cichorium intybus TaxID=13427 RepID=A0ACB9FCJ8_CICIN|nr:hypothetical protein L2E82_19386 [Cichorium intybus]